MYSLIIIDYKSSKETLDYIQSFSQHCKDWKLCHPIVIDNYSDQNSVPHDYYDFGTVKYVTAVDGKKVFSVSNEKITLLYCCYGENAGFAKGNNLGAKISNILFRDSYYLFSNSDIILCDIFDIERYVKIFNKYQDVAAIGPRVITPNGKEQSPCKKIGVFRQLFINYWGYAIPFVKVSGDLDYNGCSKKCYWVSGCFMLVRAEVFNQIEGFDDNTFLYAEEMILAEKMLRQSYHHYFDCQKRIIHLGGGTTKRENTNIKLATIRFDSLCYYMRQYRNVKPWILCLSKFNFGLYIIITRVKNAVRSI